MLKIYGVVWGGWPLFLGGGGSKGFGDKGLEPGLDNLNNEPSSIVSVSVSFEVGQLLCLCFFGFYPWPYIKMIFPLLLFAFLPIRMFLMPKFIERKYLQVLDGIHP